MTRRRLTALAATAALVTGSVALAATPAGASATPVTAADRGEVVVELAPSHPEYVAALERTPHASPEVRSQLIEAAAAPAGAALEVEKWAATQGFSAKPDGFDAVDLTGDRDLLATAFGTSITAAAGGAYLPTSALAVPAAIASVASSAVGLDTRRLMVPRLTPHTAGEGFTPAQLANAYDASPAASAGTGVTVATVQFQNWNPGDAATWAQANNIAEPPISTVDVQPLDAATADPSGNIETPLDVEAVMAGAPAARQLVYVSNGDETAGIVDMYSRLVADAHAGKFQILSTSWGGCEQFESQPDNIIAPVEQDLKMLAAMGVTILAASGDAGAYDCDENGDAGYGLAVDFPGSSPEVLDVGGTSISQSASTGHWTSTGWSSPGASSSSGDAEYAGDGSGGGASGEDASPFTGFARPTYQSGLAIAGSTRLVPDVSLDADPKTGMEAYAAGGWNQYGGTSLASPLLAGYLAGVLSTSSSCAGGTCAVLGDLHTALYANAANPDDVYDVTSGGNHFFRAGSGFDEVTGLGSPDIGNLAQTLLGGVGPLQAYPDPVFSVVASTNSAVVPVTISGAAGYSVAVVDGYATSCAGVATSTTLPTSATLTTQGANVLTLVSVDPTGYCHLSTAQVDLDGVAPSGSVTGALAVANKAASVIRLKATESATWQVTVERLGKTATTVLATSTAASSLLLNLTPGTYTVTAIPTDAAGNVGAAVRATWSVPLDDRGLKRSGHWRLAHVAKAFAGTVLTSTSKGSKATGTGWGTSVRVDYFCLPKGGSLKVIVDGKLRTTINLWCGKSVSRDAVVRHLTLGTHTVQLELVAGKHGTSASLDDLIIKP